MRPPLLALFAVLLAGSVTLAQSERYELGARMKAFEAEWDKQKAADARKRALAVVGDVTQQFLTFQLGKAGQTLDNARFALQSDKPPSDAVLWATSLYPEVKKRLVTGDEVEVTVKQFYKTDAKRPDKVSVRCGFDGKTWTTAEVEKLPVKVMVPIPKTVNRPADLTLTMEVVQDLKTLATRTVGVSGFDGPVKDHILALELAALTLPQQVKPEMLSQLEAASYRERVTLLNDLVTGTVPELDAPAAARAIEMTKMLYLRGKGKDYFTPENSGDHWLTVPTGKDGKTLTQCRLFVPEKLDPKKPVPLVVAMHGMGGSENLFFEGYGNGHVVKLCKERGWLLVSPRAGLGFGLTPAPPFGEIVDELAKRYPVDPKRVFVVGHSMGSGMAIEAAQKYPGKFAAIASLAGGGSVRKAEAFDGLPVFVGIGDKDFALKAARGLRTAVEKTKAKVTFKEYPDVEHLVIVREALGDVFDQWDKMK